jgi:hypothetical protein
MEGFDHLLHILHYLSQLLGILLVSVAFPLYEILQFSSEELWVENCLHLVLRFLVNYFWKRGKGLVLVQIVGFMEGFQ